MPLTCYDTVESQCRESLPVGLQLFYQRICFPRLCGGRDLCGVFYFFCMFLNLSSHKLTAQKENKGESNKAKHYRVPNVDNEMVTVRQKKLRCQSYKCVVVRINMSVCMLS